MFAGYTLQPVPKWLNDQFDNNIILKFVILVVIGITALYPIDEKKFLYIVLTSVITLALFEILRKFDKKKDSPKEEPKLDSKKNDFYTQKVTSSYIKN